MRHKVRVTREAESQISAISVHIAQDSPSNARRWRASLLQRLRTLRDFPDRHEIAYRADAVGKDIRHTFFGTYRILYTIEGRTVVVLSVRHGARQPLTREEVRGLGR